MATKLKVNYEFVGDSDIPVTRTESIKHGNDMLNSVINAAVSTANSKADKTYVDTELGKKANASNVAALQTAVNNKADSATVSALSGRVSTNETNISAANARIDAIATITPDTFDGTNDFEKLQNCINYAQSNNIYNIVLNRKYDITGHTLKFILPENVTNQGSNHTNRNLFRLIGTGGAEIYKGDSGFIFDADKLAHGLCVQNIKFFGNPDVSRANRCDVFNSKTIIRVTSINNYYGYLRDVFHSENGIHSVMQSYKTFGDTVCDCNSYLTSYTTMTDCCFTSCTIENSTYGFYFTTKGKDSTLIGVNIVNCVIEGIDEYCILFDTNETGYTVYLAGVGITGTYFESQNKTMVKFGQSNLQNVTVSNNTFSMNGLIDAYCIKLHVLQNSINIGNALFENNDFSTNSASVGGCIYIDNTTSFKPHKIDVVGIYKNFTNAKSAFNFMSNYVALSNKIEVSGTASFAMPISLGVGDACTLFAVDNDNPDYFFEYKVVRKSDGFKYYLINNNRMVITIINPYGTVQYNLSQSQNITVYGEYIYARN